MSVVSRYARAFADVVIDKKLDPREVGNELWALVSAMESAPALRTIWENPSVETRQKNAVLDKIVSRVGGSRMLRNFLAVLIEHGRVAALPEIARQLQVELNERMGMVDAEVTSARQLQDQEKRALEERVSAVTGKQVHARYATDPGLLGGAVVKVGSTVYDGSLRGQLEKLKQELSSETTSS